MPKRLMPTRENLRRIHSQYSASEDEVAGVELFLYLNRAADVCREEIYGRLHEASGLTEGKFALLMALYDAEKPVPLVELAERVGVSASTTSIMVGRMMKAEHPLVAKTTAEADARSTLVSLTDAGRSIVESALPDHSNRVGRFMNVLSNTERETMIALLKKLVDAPRTEAPQTSKAPAAAGAQRTSG